MLKIIHRLAGALTSIDWHPVKAGTVPTRPVVNAAVFATDAFFLGIPESILSGSVAKALEEYRPGNSSSIIGDLATGKTLLLEILTAYHIYLATYENGVLVRNALSQDSPILIANVAGTAGDAARIRQDMRILIENSPYFKNLQIRWRTGSILFPNNVGYFATQEVLSFVGENLFFAGVELDTLVGSPLSESSPVRKINFRVQSRFPELGSVVTAGQKRVPGYRTFELIKG